MLYECRYTATNRYLDEQLKTFQGLDIYSPAAISPKFKIHHNVEIIRLYLQKKNKYIIDII